MAKVPFFFFLLDLFGLDMNIEMYVIIYMYLKHSPDYIDSKYILVHGQTSKVQVILIIYLFWHF